MSGNHRQLPHGCSAFLFNSPRSISTCVVPDATVRSCAHLPRILSAAVRCVSHAFTIHRSLPSQLVVAPSTMRRPSLETWPARAMMGLQHTSQCPNTLDATTFKSYVPLTLLTSFVSCTS